MRSTCYAGVCTEPDTYYPGWFMYMRYTQGQNEEYTYYPGVCMISIIRKQLDTKHA